MSYILDALKKSEQERGHGAVPGVQTVHSSSINYHSHRRSLWPWLLLVAVVVNIFALVYLMQSRTPATPVVDIASRSEPATVSTRQQAATAEAMPVVPAPPQVTPPQQATAPQSVPQQPMQPTLHDEPWPAANTVATLTPAPAKPQAAAQPAHSEAMDINASAAVDSYIADLEELPLNVRQHIPQMTFSAHVYSSNASQRSLVINGRFMEEGDRVTNELRLIEITRNGAIFDHNGQRFSTSVITGWN